MEVPEIRRSIDRLNLVYRLYHWAWTGLDLLYPPHCGGCNKSGARWCGICQNRVSYLRPPLCVKCGRMVLQVGLCPNCRLNSPPYQALRSWAFYEGALRNAIRRLKYAGDMALGEILSHPLIQMLRELNWQIEIVTPVPQGHIRQETRGYNQAALLAFPLALNFRLAYRPEVLVKVRETRSQVGLSLAERFENVAGVFKANPKIAKGKTILVIDDVTTSGATMQACGSALMDAGASLVYSLTLARAEHQEFGQ